MPYNIIVCVKQIADEVRIDPSTNEPVISNPQYRMEDISKNAVEEAVRIKEKYGGKITALMFCSDSSTPVMKEALAMGADEGIIITGYKENSPDFSAAVLAEKIKSLQYDIVIAGYASADSYTAQIPARLSKLLGVPLLGSAIKVDISGKKIDILREADDLDIKESADMPAVISVTQETNQPRLPLLANIIASARKPLKVEATAVQYKETSKIISDKAQQSSRKRIIYEDINKGVQEIAKFLKQEVAV